MPDETVPSSGRGRDVPNDSIDGKKKSEPKKGKREQDKSREAEKKSQPKDQKEKREEASGGPAKAEPRREIKVERKKTPEEDKIKVTVTYEQALTAAKVVGKFREPAGKDGKTRISGADVENLKGFLQSSGFEVSKMDTAAMVNLAEETFAGHKGKHVEIEEISDKARDEVNKRVVDQGGVVGKAYANELLAAARRETYAEERRSEGKTEQDLQEKIIRARLEVVPGKGKGAKSEVSPKLAEEIKLVYPEPRPPEPSRSEGIVESAKELYLLGRKAAQEAITKAGVDFQLPENWDDEKKWNPVSRGVYLMKNKIVREPELKDLYEFKAAGTKWTTTGHPDSNDAVEIDEARRRLKEVDTDETNGTFTAAVLLADREELVARLGNLRIAKLAAIAGPGYRDEDRYGPYAEVVAMSLDELREIRAIERTLAATGGVLPLALTNQRNDIRDFLLGTEYNAAMDVVQKMADAKREFDRLTLAGPPIPVDLQDDIEGLRPVFNDLVTRLIGAGGAGGGIADWKGAPDLLWGRQRDFALDPTVAARATLQNENIKGGYKFAFDFARAVTRAEILAQANDATASLDGLISRDMRDSIKYSTRKLARYFEEKKGILPRNVQDDLFKEINRQTKALDDRARLYGFTPEIYDFLMALQFGGMPERRGYEGMLEWQATEATQGYRSNFDDENESGPPKNWRDSWKHANNNLRAVESEELPVQSLQRVLEKVANIGLVLGQIGPGSPDKAEADRMRERIEKLYKAVFAKVQERETLQSSGWDPDKVADVYLSPNWTDETFRVYYERFNEDDEGHVFKYIDAHGVEQEFNLLDKAMQIYYKHYAEDKRKLNMAEALTLMDLDHEVTGAGDLPKDVLALFKKDAGGFTGADIARLERVRREILVVLASKMNPPGLTLPANFHELDDAGIDALYGALTPAQIAAAGNAWHIDANSSRPGMRSVITEWMTDRTLVGAVQKKEVMWEDPVTHILKPKTILEWRKWQMSKELEAWLQVNMVDTLPTGALAGALGMKLDRYIKTGLTRQAANVAYWEAYAMGAPFSYGTVRIFDKGKNWYDNDFGTVKQVRDIAYTDDTNSYYARIVDDVMGYYVDENRGKRDTSDGDKLMSVNAIWQKSMLGKRHGVLPQNRILTKIVRDNIRNSREFRDLLVDPTHGDFDHQLHVAIEDLDNLDTLGHNGHHLDGDEEALARSYAIGEMIDDGIISFENTEWSKVFANRETNISRFYMIDMWADRKGMKRVFNNLQVYLRRPNKETFFKLMGDDVFYSLRERIIHPFMKQMTPAHFELGKYEKKLWGADYNLSRAEKEEFLHEAMLNSMLDKKSEHHMKNDSLRLKVFGKKIPFLTMIRPLQLLEFTRNMGKEILKKSPILLFIILWELFKGMFSSGVAELKGK